MLKPFSFGLPLLFRTPVWVNLPSDSEVSLLLRPLSYADVMATYSLFYLAKQSADFHNIVTYTTVLENAVIDYKNAIGFPTITLLLQQLSPKDLKYLHDQLILISVVTQEHLEAMANMLEIQFNPQFSEDSWNCAICQEKKLDYSRACGFLPEDERDPAPILPSVGTKRFTQCPISTIDPFVVNQMSLAYSLLDSGVLPEDGGIGKQTDWFVKSAMLYKRKLKEAEHSAIERKKKR